VNKANLHFCSDALHVTLVTNRSAIASRLSRTFLFRAGGRGSHASLSAREGEAQVGSGPVRMGWLGRTGRGESTIFPEGYYPGSILRSLRGSARLGE
jgi:hypothetical protein